MSVTMLFGRPLANKHFILVFKWNAASTLTKNNNPTVQCNQEKIDYLLWRGICNHQIIYCLPQTKSKDLHTIVPSAFFTPFRLTNGNQIGTLTLPQVARESTHDAITEVGWDLYDFYMENISFKIQTLCGKNTTQN